MKKKIGLVSLVLAILPVQASAALIDLNFMGKFETGEDLSGVISYEVAEDKSGQNVVEFFGLVKRFDITSTKFVSISGSSMVSGIDSASTKSMNKIRYFSGTNLTFNSIQFSQASSDNADAWGHRPDIFLNAGVPVGTFTTGVLPSAFSFVADNDHRMNLNYSYDNPDGDRYLTAYATITSMTAAPAVSAAVPEPATWAMMIAGFGVMGAALRRRRRTVATA